MKPLFVSYQKVAKTEEDVKDAYIMLAVIEPKIA